jgi:aminoglycoside phosphotransferase (APT) family kinase protein
MPATPDGADAEVLPRLEAAAQRHYPGARVHELRRLSGGASRESWSFDLATASSKGVRSCVLRRDRGAPNPLALRLPVEARLVEAVAATGVSAPRVLFTLEPEDGLGDGYVTDRAAGETIPRRILRDPNLASARRLLARQCGEILARIHAVGTDTLPSLPTSTLSDQLALYESLLDALGEPHPAFELGLRYLASKSAALAETKKIALVHGDFRNGNLVVGPEGVRCVLDWELAHLGDPMEDLGWFCVRSWRFGVTDKPAGGFGTREELFDGYEAASGARPDPATVEAWELLGTIKWGVICMLQRSTHLSGAHRSVELAALGRRVCETEWDVLGYLGERDNVRQAHLEPRSQPDPHQDLPTAAQLVEAVRSVLDDELRPSLEGRHAYHARVASNILGIVGRELEDAGAAAETERGALANLLGRETDTHITLGELRRQLAARIRDGSLHDRDGEVFAAVAASVAAKLRIANPAYTATHTHTT